MLIIIDKRLPDPAKKRLMEYGRLLELETSGITYQAVSGHPDIFFAQVGQKLIAAPNTPDFYFRELKECDADIQMGFSAVGRKYPQSAVYNAVVTDQWIVHNAKITDPKVTEVAGTRQFLHVNQGYTRCNLVFLSKRAAVTSDAGIQQKLESRGVEVLFFNSGSVLLPGYSHGFFGGACGLWGDQLFLAGNPDLHPHGVKLRDFVAKAGIEIICLYDGPLFDGGGILFV
jgi:hypothetical protein